MSVLCISGQILFIFNDQKAKLTVDLPVLLSSSHALLIHRTLQLTLGREDGLMVDDYGLNDLINVGLTSYGVMIFWYGHQCGAEANGQVVGVHHVLITVLRQTAEAMRGNEDHSVPSRCMLHLQ